MIDDDIEDNSDAALVCCGNKSFQLRFGSEVGIDFREIEDPVTMVSCSDWLSLFEGLDGAIAERWESSKWR